MIIKNSINPYLYLLISLIIINFFGCDFNKKPATYNSKLLIGSWLDRSKAKLHEAGGHLDFNVGSNYGTTTDADRLWISSHTTGQSDVPGSYYDIINISSSSTHGIQIASGYGASSGSLFMRTRSDNSSAPAGAGLQAWKISIALFL